MKQETKTLESKLRSGRVRPLVTVHTQKTILSSLLKENKLMGLTALQPKHFRDYAVIFRAMQKLYDEGKPIDHALLIGELYDKLSNIGGPQVLTELSRVEVDTDNFKAYEKDLIEQWQLKEIKRLQKVEITNLE